MNWDWVGPAIPGGLLGVAAVITAFRSKATVNGKLDVLLELKDHLAATAAKAAEAAAAAAKAAAEAAEASAYIRGRKDEHDQR